MTVKEKNIKNIRIKNILSWIEEEIVKSTTNEFKVKVDDIAKMMGDGCENLGGDYLAYFLKNKLICQDIYVRKVSHADGTYVIIGRYKRDELKKDKKDKKKTDKKEKKEKNNDNVLCLPTILSDKINEINNKVNDIIKDIGIELINKMENIDIANIPIGRCCGTYIIITENGYMYVGSSIDIFDRVRRNTIEGNLLRRNLQIVRCVSLYITKTEDDARDLEIMLLCELSPTLNILLPDIKKLMRIPRNMKLMMKDGKYE